MKRLSVLLLLLSLFILTAWTLEDCVEVDFDHPDCDQYTTTTTGVTPSSTTTTSTPEGSTTSTTGAEQSTTTSTPTESTTTTPEPSNTPTTTVAQCPPGMSHQPPMCVPTTVPFFETTTADTTPVISPPEELPRTGIADVGLLALAGVSLLFLGFVALKYGRAEE